MNLSSDWDKEAYVKLYLVQKLLNFIVPLESPFSRWEPEFCIKIPAHSHEKRVDYLIEDYSRNIRFLVEVKTAKTRINDEARFQLDMYLRYSGVKFGLLIDPFLVEIYEFSHGQSKLKNQVEIKDVTDLKPVATFIKMFLENIKMRTIAIHNSKGGVGKTTLATNIAYELVKRGHKVLVVDLDAQANASLTIGVNKAEEMNNASSVEELREIYQFLDERLEVIDFIKLANKEGKIEDYKKCIMSISNPFKVDVLPASHKTSDENLPTNPLRLKFLDKGLKKLVGDYQYVIFDTAPSKTQLTWFGLYAAKYLVIPSQMEYLSVYGIKNVIQNAREVQEDTNKERGNILGIVPMMVEKNRTLNKTVEGFIKCTFPKVPILPEIKRATGVGKALHQRLPISLFAEYDKESRTTAQSLANLTDKLLELIEQLENQNG